MTRKNDDGHDGEFDPFEELFGASADELTGDVTDQGPEGGPSRTRSTWSPAPEALSAVPLLPEEMGQPAPVRATTPSWSFDEAILGETGTGLGAESHSEAADDDPMLSDSDPIPPSEVGISSRAISDRLSPEVPPSESPIPAAEPPVVRPDELSRAEEHGIRISTPSDDESLRRPIDRDTPLQPAADDSHSATTVEPADPANPLTSPLPSRRELRLQAEREALEREEQERAEAENAAAESARADAQARADAADSLARAENAARADAAAKNEEAAARAQAEAQAEAAAEAAMVARAAEAEAARRAAEEKAAAQLAAQKRVAERDHDRLAAEQNSAAQRVADERAAEAIAAAQAVVDKRRAENGETEVPSVSASIEPDATFTSLLSVSDSGDGATSGPTTPETPVAPQANGRVWSSPASVDATTSQLPTIDSLFFPAGAEDTTTDDAAETVDRVESDAQFVPDAFVFRHPPQGPLPPRPAVDQPFDTVIFGVAPDIAQESDDSPHRDTPLPPLFDSSLTDDITTDVFSPLTSQTEAPTGGASEPENPFAELLGTEGSPGMTRTARPTGTPRKKRRLVISLIIIGALLIAAVGGGLVVWASYGDKISDYFGWSETDYDGSGSGEVVVSIAAGDDGYAIAKTLEANGVVLTADAFVKHVLAQDPAPVFHPGAYTVAKKMSSAAALEAILNPDNRVEMTAVIPEGSRASRVYEIVSGVTGIPVADFEAAAKDPTVYGVPASAPNIEGWLFPATYEFAVDDTADTILQKLVNRMVQALDQAGVAVDDRERVLTIASVIQREARAEDAFYKVSRVIQNRLDQGMKLQMDSTTKYGMPNGSTEVWTTDEQRASDNGWNTYFHTGLPIGPISNPGDLAIKAALNPAEGDWVYFVTVNQETGETLFSSTLAEHNELVKQAQQWCVANPDNPAC